MALDESLGELEGMEVGNVERAVREITDSQAEAQEASDKTDKTRIEMEDYQESLLLSKRLEVELYRELLQDKLFGLIRNIAILGDQVYHAPFKYRREEGKTLIINDTSSGTTLVAREPEPSNFKHYDYYDRSPERHSHIFHFNFGDDSNSLEEMSFFVWENTLRYTSRSLKNLFSKSYFFKTWDEGWFYRAVFKFEADSIGDFVGKLVDYIAPSDEEIKHPHIPYFLNSVPGMISNMYSVFAEKEKKRLEKEKGVYEETCENVRKDFENTKKEVGGLESLDTSDFS